MDDHPPPLPLRHCSSAPINPNPLPLIPPQTRFLHSCTNLFAPLLQALVFFFLGRHWGYTPLDAFQLFSTAAAIMYATPHIGTALDNRSLQTHALLAFAFAAHGVALLTTLLENVFFLGLGLALLGIQCLRALQCRAGLPHAVYTGIFSALTGFAAAALCDSTWVTTSAGLLLAGLFARICWEQHASDWYKLFACAILLILATLFFAGYYEMPSTGSLFTDMQVTDAFAASNGYWVLLTGPLLTRWYYNLAARPLGQWAPWICILGLVLSGLSFYGLPFFAQYANQHTALTLGHWIWLDGFVWGTGEVLFSAGGLIVMLHSVPRHWAWFLIVVWHLTPALGTATLDMLPTSWHTPDFYRAANASMEVYLQAIAQCGWFIWSLALCFACCLPLFRRLMQANPQSSSASH